MKIIYATDIHGDAKVYERLLKETEDKEISALLIGGDITPYYGIGSMHIQRVFLKEYLIPRLETFSIKSGKPVFIMMGNDDFSINYDLLEKADAEGTIKLIHNKVLQLEKINVAGYSFIPPTPFMLKDWEKSEEEIASDLRKLSSKTDASRTVFMFHVPPAGTDLDVLYNGSHIGSTAVLGFIKRKQPMMTLHGHIHESYEMTENWKQKIGRTFSMNPSNKAFVVIDIADPEKSVLKKH